MCSTPVATMDDDDRARVGVDGPLKVGAHVTHHVTSLTGSQFFVVKHRHGGVDHDEPRTAFSYFVWQTRHHGDELVGSESASNLQRSKRARSRAKLGKPRRKSPGVQSACTIDPVHDVPIGQGKRHPCFGHGARSFPMPPFAKQQMDTRLTGSKLGCWAWSSRGQRMHGLTELLVPPEPVVNRIADPSPEVKRRPQTPSTLNADRGRGRKDPRPLRLGCVLRFGGNASSRLESRGAAHHRCRPKGRKGKGHRQHVQLCCKGLWCAFCDADQ